MKDEQLYLQAAAMLTPVFSAAACLILTGFSCLNSLSLQESRLKRIHLFYLSMTAVAWFLTYAYMSLPALFVVLNAACLASYVLAPVFFFRIVRLLTRFEQAEDFSAWHYVAPAALAASLLAWSMNVPFDMQVAFVKSRQLTMAGDYEAFSRFFTSKPLWRLVFLLCYSTLAVLTLVRYYHHANRNDSLVRRPARWVMFLIAILTTVALSSVVVLFMPRDEPPLAGMIVAATGMVAQHVLLTFHIIRRKYLLYTIREPKKKRITDTGRRLHAGTIDSKDLDLWFREEKPYLNANFKITDVVDKLDVNRSVVSAFINHHYGVNFNQWINQWRMKELEWLMIQPENKGKKEYELAVEAGFGDMRKYYRARKKELRVKSVALSEVEVLRASH